MSRKDARALPEIVSFPSAFGLLHFLGQVLGQVLHAVVALHFQSEHAADAVVGMAAAAAGLFARAELVHKVRVVHQGLGHLKPLETGPQHLLHFGQGGESAHIDERHFKCLTELQGVFQEIGFPIRDSGN